MKREGQTMARNTNMLHFPGTIEPIEATDIELQLILTAREQAQRNVADGDPEEEIGSANSPWWWNEGLMSWLPLAIERSLSHAHRLAIRMVILEELPLAKAAGWLGVSEAGARKLLDEALAFARPHILQTMRDRDGVGPDEVAIRKAQARRLAA